jgi:hypothetical protein
MAREHTSALMLRLFFCVLFFGSASAAGFLEAVPDVAAPLTFVDMRPLFARAGDVSLAADSSSLSCAMHRTDSISRPPAKLAEMERHKDIHWH